MVVKRDMRLPLIIIRPEPGASKTANDAHIMGLAAVKIPSFAITPMDWTMPDGVDSLLLGSANAVRHAGADLPRLKPLPVYAVGKATAKAAQAVGLDVRFAGATDLEEAMDALAADGWSKPLRLCGAQHTVLQERVEMTVTTIINYAAMPRSLSAEQIEIFKQPAVILVHSARAMQQLETNFCDQDDLTESIAAKHSIIAISQRIAENATLPWRHIAVSQSPNDSDMLKLAEKFCDTGHK